MYTLLEMLSLAGLPTDRKTLSAAATGLRLPGIYGPASFSQTFAWHYDRLSRSIALDRLQLYFDRFGRFCGHVLWTLLNEAEQARLIEKGPGALSNVPSADGHELWLLDFGAAYGELPNILSDIRTRLLKPHGRISYLRFKRESLIAKRITSADYGLRLREARRSQSRCAAQSLLARKEGAHLLQTVRSLLVSAVELGRCLALFRMVQRYAELPSKAAVARVQRPLSIRQVRLWLSADDDPIGFMSWAWLREDFRSMTMLPQLHDLPLFEWNDGEQLCLADFLVHKASANQVIRELATDFYPTEDLSIYPSWGGMRRDDAGAPTISRFNREILASAQTPFANASPMVDMPSVLRENASAPCQH